MNRRLLFLLISMVALSSLQAAEPTPATPSDAEVKARASALEVAGGFSNEGFKIRDGHATLSITPKAPRFIQVNLSSGNQYWFIAAAADPAKRLAVSLYDEKGKPIPTESYENKAQAAAGFSPQISGPYIVRVEELEGAPATFCLLYSYK
jgi:hypothetical protein